jgi:hypothetical protein
MPSFLESPENFLSRGLPPLCFRKSALCLGQRGQFSVRVRDVANCNRPLVMLSDHVDIVLSLLTYCLELFSEDFASMQRPWKLPQSNF